MFIHIYIYIHTCTHTTSRGNNSEKEREKPACKGKRHESTSHSLIAINSTIPPPAPPSNPFHTSPATHTSISPAACTTTAMSSSLTVGFRHLFVVFAREG